MTFFVTITNLIFILLVFMQNIGDWASTFHVVNILSLNSSGEDSRIILPLVGKIRGYGYFSAK